MKITITKIYTLIILALTLALCANDASAYVIDGDLSDWGVTPFTDWAPNRSTVDYVIEDDIERYGSDPFEERPA